MALAPDPASVSVAAKGIVPASWDPLILPIDKPFGWTSFDVLRKLKGVSPVRKIGHAGTLDPMATGLLIVLSGKATRLMNHFLTQEKVYEGTIRLGQTTASWDAETEVEEERDAGAITDRMISDAIAQFTGAITQTTPVYSAVKVGGERLYKKARRGERPVLPTRSVTVHAFELCERRGSDLDVRITCSSGTYIRSLAHEMGQALGVGGHLSRLCRTRIGPLHLEQAWDLSAFLDEAASEGPQP